LTRDTCGADELEIGVDVDYVSAELEIGPGMEDFKVPPCFLAFDFERFIGLVSDT
jgi:hypothetical protein